MDERICFVIMPFGEQPLPPHGVFQWDELYTDHVKRIVEEMGLKCLRADEILRPGNIVTDVVDNLADAFLVIAELTGHNPNVFYELGVRHAISQRTILLAQDAELIPFDLRAIRTIVYTFTPRGAEMLCTRLRAMIGEVLAHPNVRDSPVQKYLDDRNHAISHAMNCFTASERFGGFEFGMVLGVG
jgi:hypothetical protein